MYSSFDNKSSELDLHGLSVNEAVSSATSFLISFINDEYMDEIKIITGKGTGSLIVEIEYLLEDYRDDLEYYFDNKKSAFIIRK